jgi:hypothetical protein
MRRKLTSGRKYGPLLGLTTTCWSSNRPTYRYITTDFREHTYNNTYISNTLGYHQTRVEVKDMIPGGPPIELWEWNNDKKHVCKTITELETRLTTHTSFPRVATSRQSTPYKVCTVLPQPVGLPPSLPELAIHGLRACIHPYLYTLHNHSRTIDKHR